MPVSEVLDEFRKSDYGKKKDEPTPKMEEGGAEGRTIQLTDDELKSLGYEDGKEVQCTVTGRLDGGRIHVTSVSTESTMPDQEEMEQKVAGLGEKAPVMRPQTMPYPS